MAQSGSLSSEFETLGQVPSLVKAFRSFDSDKDGLITSSELGGILASLGYSASDDEKVQEMTLRGDNDKDGKLSMKEFLDMNTKDRELGGFGGFFGCAFEAFDADGDETVTGEELFEVLVCMEMDLSLEDCQETVEAMDEDGDRAAMFEDFELIINSLL